MADSDSKRSPHDRRVDALIAEIELAIEQGLPLDFEEFLKLHPEHAVDVRKYFEDAGHLHKAFQPFRPEPEETQAVPGSTQGDDRRGTTVRYFGDYEILEELGSGGMGVVYKARQKKLKRLVALKMIKRGQFASEEDVRRFQAEAQAAAKLDDHPGIVRVIEVGLHQGEHYYAMDYVAGGSLSALYREQPVAARRAAELVKKLAEAMHFAHGKGIVHRDLKPANVLLTTTGAPRITDFGLAMRIRSDDDSTGVNMTQAGQVLGTAGYMSPEQAVGKTGTVNTPTDIYSLGAILYALLTSRAPFVGESPSVTIHHVINNEPVPLRALNPSVPRDLETICLKCLEKEPQKRYTTAQLLADDLGRFLENKPVLARPVSTGERTWRWCRRNPWIAGLSATVAFSLLIGTIVSSSLAVVAHNRGESLGNALGTVETKLKENKKLTEDRSEALDESRWQVYRLRIMRMEQLWLQKDWGHLERLLAESKPKGDEKDLRGWEWHYLQRQLERRAWRMHESPEKLVTIDWDRQAEKLAVLCSGKIEIWHPRDRQLLKSISVPVANNGCNTLRWSPDHRNLAAMGTNGLTVHIVDTETGQIVCSLEDPDLTSNSHFVSHVDWSPRGDCVAVTIGHRCIRLWKVAQPSLPFKTLELDDGVTPQRIHWSPDQATCVTTSQDGWAVYWNTADWSRLQKKRLATDWCNDEAWSPDGTRMSLASKVIVVASADGTEIKQLADQGAVIRTVRWLDNERLVTENEAQELRIVHVDQQTPDEVFRLHPQLISAISVGSHGQIASAAPGESVKIWFPSDIAVEHITLRGARLPSQATACNWHPRSNVLGLVSLHQGSNLAATWSPGASQVENMPLTSGTTSVFWTHSGDALAIETIDGSWKTLPWPPRASTSPTITTQRTGQFYSAADRFRVDVQLYSQQFQIVDTRGKQGSIEPKVDVIYAYAWNPCKSCLAVAHSKSIHLYAPLLGQPSGVRTPADEWISETRTLAWTSDGKHLLAGTSSGVIYFLDGVTLEVLYTLRGHAGAITAVGASGDGTRIVSAGFDGFMRWWDAKRGIELFKIPITKSDRICELHFSADGQWLAARSESGSVYVWTIDRQVTLDIVNMPPVVKAATSSNVKAEATVESLTTQIIANSQNGDALAQRAKLHHIWHRWAQAADDYQQCLRLSPDDPWKRQDLAITSLAAGREKDYFRHCREIETQLSQLTSPDILHTRAARILSLRPDGFVDGEKLLNMAVKMAEKEPDKWYLVHPQVPLLFRLKRYDEALHEARRIPRESLDGVTLAPLHAWESMILWRLDRRPEAREAIVLAQKCIKDTRGSVGQPWGDGDHLIEAEIALREAEALVTAEEN